MALGFLSEQFQIQQKSVDTDSYIYSEAVQGLPHANWVTF